MTYRDNVTKLASELGISNEPGLREEDLEIASLRFFSHYDSESIVMATDMNRGGRLFIQAHATISGDKIPSTQIPCDDRLRACAAEYFAELWENNPVPGRRPLIDGLRHHDFIAITYKWEE